MSNDKEMTFAYNNCVVSAPILNFILLLTLESRSHLLLPGGSCSFDGGAGLRSL